MLYDFTEEADKSLRSKIKQYIIWWKKKSKLNNFIQIFMLEVLKGLVELLVK